MVGAGGIGCELLKNLVLTGFGEVHIVDLDTIDLSNLNRQFLFRHEHIKKSKALVAREAAQRFNPNVKIIAHHANIKDPQFNIDWFRTFTLVFNALDNLDARRHVNKMCLAADIPLIESGTTGFNGQVQVIKRGQTECYDCNEKETPKTFPVCTIRSTPSQPIHCIVWAKSYLFAEIFGTSEDDSPELNLAQDSTENAGEIEQLKKEAQALKQIRASMGSEEFPRKVFEKVFTEDINRLRSMEDMWKTRRKPDALNFDEILHHVATVDPDTAAQDQVVWSLAENFAVFSTSLKKLSFRLDQLRSEAAASSSSAAPPVLSFDKDDKDTLDFVAATSNLRSIIFDIERKSEFDIKQMAGNIIPAIATTNAMTAGLCVLQAFKVLRSDYAHARMVFLTRSTDRVISSEPLSAPKPNCPVCGVCHARIEIDLNRATLADVVELLKQQLGYEEFSISSDAGGLYDPDFEDNLSKRLKDLGVNGSTFLTVMDEGDEDTRVNLVLSTSTKEIAEDEKPVLLAEELDIPRKTVAVVEQQNGTNGHAHGDGEVSIPEAAAVGTKRKREREDSGADADGIAAKVSKKEKVVGESGDSQMMSGNSKIEALVLGDEDDGAIIID